MKDIDVRRVLLATIDELHPDKADTRIVQELGICQGSARVDIAVVNGTIHGYEIKSERDTLARLRAQSDIYSTALEFVTIVAASSHIEAISDIVPVWWGMWVAAEENEGLVFKELRIAARNPALASNALVQFLWKDEALQILIEHKLAKGMAGKTRQQLWDRLSANFDADALGGMVRHQLKQRSSSWRSLALQA